MDLFRIKSVSDKNLDRMIQENFYRGHVNYEKAIIYVQCMNKDIHIIFNFRTEEVIISNEKQYNRVYIDSISPKLMASKIVEAIR